MLEVQVTELDNVHRIAVIICPEAFNGGSPNGRLDEAEAYDKAQQVLEVLREEMEAQAIEELKETVSDHYVLSSEAVSDVRDYAKRGDTGGVLKAIQGVKSLEELLQEEEE